MLSALLPRLASATRHAASGWASPLVGAVAATPLAWGRLWSAGHGSSVAQQVVRGLKTHSGTKKRFTKLPSGKFKRDKIGRVHLNTGTSGAEIRRGRRPQYANLTQEKNLQKLMPF